MELKEAILELLRRAATDLSPDVEEGIKTAFEREAEGTPAKNVFKTILENIGMARGQSTPLCQDTGSIVFFIDYPEGGIEREFKEAIIWAVKEATANQYLRPNAVDPITAKNTGNNLGLNAPYIHFHQWQKDEGCGYAI